MVKIYQGLGAVGVVLGSLALSDLLGLARQTAVDCPVEIVRASGLAERSPGIQEESAMEATAGFDSARGRG